jgi:Tol biopolymer transport system component
MHADGTAVEQLTNHCTTGGSCSPCWSPDSTRLCIVSRRDGYGSLYAINADGSGEERLTAKPHMDDDFPAWSPDGERIAFSRSNREGADALVVLHIPSRTARRQTDGRFLDGSPAWSPDGRWIVFGGLAAPCGLYVIPYRRGCGLRFRR